MPPHTKEFDTSNAVLDDSYFPRYYETHPEDEKRHAHDFNIGDYVVVRWDTTRKEDTIGATFTEHMKRYAGKIAKITELIEHPMYPGYRLDINRNGYIWQDQMLYGVDWFIQPEEQENCANIKEELLKCLNLI